MIDRGHQQHPNGSGRVGPSGTGARRPRRADVDHATHRSTPPERRSLPRQVSWLTDRRPCLAFPVRTPVTVLGSGSPLTVAGAASASPRRARPNSLLAHGPRTARTLTVTRFHPGPAMSRPGVSGRRGARPSGPRCREAGRTPPSRRRTRGRRGGGQGARPRDRQGVARGDRAVQHGDEREHVGRGTALRAALHDEPTHTLPVLRHEHRRVAGGILRSSNALANSGRGDPIQAIAQVPDVPPETRRRPGAGRLTMASATLRSNSPSRNGFWTMRSAPTAPTVIRAAVSA